LCSTCDFYHFFVASSSTTIPHPTLITSTLKFRKSLLKSWDLFLKLSLSGKRENWFPAFMSVVMAICGLVILTDAVSAVPAATRKAIWGDIEAVIKDLRVRQHALLVELLKIGAKGINPLRLDYWVWEEGTDGNVGKGSREGEDGLFGGKGEVVKRRNSKGMALLGQDGAAFDGFVALRGWHDKYKGAMSGGNEMWESVPYTLAHIQAIAALSRVFEF
jgi:hypothetical protein